MQLTHAPAICIGFSAVAIGDMVVGMPVPLVTLHLLRHGIAREPAQSRPLACWCYTASRQRTAETEVPPRGVAGEAKFRLAGI